MSRSGYDDSCDGWDLIRWRGAVNSALKGKRGQALLSEMAVALDVMPTKRLIADELISKDGEVCALGAVAKHKSLNVSGIDPHCSEQVSATFNIAEALAREIAFINDDYYGETPESRWQRMRKWVNSNLSEAEPTQAGGVRMTNQERAKRILESYQTKWGSLVHFSDLIGLIVVQLDEAVAEARNTTLAEFKHD